MAQSMFERYGGFATVSKIVMAFYDRALDSDIVGDYFEDVEVRNLIDHQTRFVSQVMGGPDAYSNEALAKIHARLAITSEAFNEMISILQETLEDFELDPRDIGAIMADFKSREPYIVTA